MPSVRSSFEERDHVLHLPRRVRVLSTRPTVLVVERDRSIRELQRVFLERAGFTVDFVEDGITALERTTAECPAVVITEILIPGLDGLTLCRRLRDEPATAHIPVIVFTILAAAARAAEAGAHAFQRKPIVESTFVAAVLEAIQTHSPATTEQQWASR